MNPTVTTLVSSQNILGESPFWHQGRESIFWVDIEAGLLQEVVLSTNKVNVWNLGMRVSLIVEGNTEELILGTQGGIVSFNLESHLTTVIVPLEKDLADRRCNDGHCDAYGRLWVGVMDTHCAEGCGSLYKIEENLKVKKMLTGLTIPNGLVWSEDNTKMYFIDTLAGVVKCFDYNLTNGTLGSANVAIVIPEEMGIPDGMAIDEEGMLWVALHGGGAVSRWNPETGRLISTIAIPALQVTNCCFVGEHLDQLVVTTASENLNALQLAQYPQSGNLFHIKNPGTRGVKPLAFKRQAV
ncbi:SMP-30/gluconolactonase/LRE family protein [Pedobacter sp. PWIIR3]